MAQGCTSKYSEMGCRMIKIAFFICLFGIANAGKLELLKTDPLPIEQISLFPITVMSCQPKYLKDGYYGYLLSISESSSGISSISGSFSQPGSIIALSPAEQVRIKVIDPKLCELEITFANDATKDKSLRFIIKNINADIYAGKIEKLKFGILPLRNDISEVKCRMAASMKTRYCDPVLKTLQAPPPPNAVE